MTQAQNAIFREKFVLPSRIRVVIIRVMTGRELQAWRQGRELSTTQLGGFLDVSSRTIEAWESDRYPIPEKKLARIRDLMKQDAAKINLPIQLYQQALAKATEKGFTSVDAYVSDLLSRVLLVAVCFFL